MGKRNWLFTSTEVGARRVGIIQSLLVTCRLHGVEPYTYLVDVLQRISEHPAKRVRELTPRMWKSLFAHDPLPSVLGHHSHEPPPHWQLRDKYGSDCPLTKLRHQTATPHHGSFQPPARLLNSAAISGLFSG